MANGLHITNAVQRSVFAVALVAFCLLGPGSSAKAGCGDYLTIGVVSAEH